jgi:hypothetical protein
MTSLAAAGINALLVLSSIATIAAPTNLSVPLVKISRSVAAVSTCRKKKRRASVVVLARGRWVSGGVNVDRWQSKLAVCVVEQNNLASVSQPR